MCVWGGGGACETVCDITCLSETATLTRIRADGSDTTHESCDRNSAFQGILDIPDWRVGN